MANDPSFTYLAIAFIATYGVIFLYDLTLDLRSRSKK